MAHGLDLIPHLPPAGASAEVAANFIPLGITGFGEPYSRDLGYTHAGSLYRMELDDTVTHFSWPSRRRRPLLLEPLALALFWNF